MDAGRFSRRERHRAGSLAVDVQRALEPLALPLGLDDEEPVASSPASTSIRSFPPEYLPDSMGFLPGVRGPMKVLDTFSPSLRSSMM